MFAFLDTPFDPDFPVYTRANAGEILPDPVPPLAWSLVGSCFEEGFRIAFCDDFGLLPRPGPDRPFQMVGRMAGRLHLNLSVIRTTAQRLPGTSADVADVQYFGDAVASGLPAHQPRSDDRRYKLKSPPTLARTLAGVGRRVDRDRARVDDLGAQVAGVLAGDRTDAELVHVLRHATAVFGEVLGTHVTCRGLTSPMLEQATSALVRAGIPEEDALRYVAEIPELESAKPSRALADIGRDIRPGTPLAEVVARGSWTVLTESDAPGAADLVRRLEGFLASYGHRGVSEFDPTNPAWEQRPDDVVKLLARQRRQPPAPHEPPDVDPGRLARPLVAAARSAMARAERTKDTAMRATNDIRRLLFVLRDRLASQVAPDLFVMLTVEDLEAAVNGGGLPVEAELRRRADDFAAASAVTPAEWSNGSLRLVEPAPEPVVAGGAVAPRLEGIAGSPGTASGHVRVLRDPYADFVEGEVLVAHMTDTAWTPLFLAASAVITDVGGVLSHATIVARDLGIPAVVNTKVASTTLHDGDLVEVDGTKGTVTVVERG